jgi:hypothetical protein
MERIMKIEYKIRYLDIVKAYFYNLRYSRRTQTTLLGASAMIAILILWITYRNNNTLTVSNYATAILTGLSLIILIPAASVFTAISQKRTFTISPQGIATHTGAGLVTKMTWKAIDSISTTEDLILITGKNVNVFAIPDKAFESNKLRKEFINLSNKYLNAAKKKSQPANVKK